MIHDVRMGGHVRLQLGWTQIIKKVGFVMAKLILRDACYNGIKNIEEHKIQNKPQHEALVKEATQRIEKNRIRYATAYKNAGSYLEK